MPDHQYSLTLISHKVNETEIPQRSQDGYINASKLCLAAKKRWHNYISLETTGLFLRALAKKTGIATTLLNQEVTTPDGLTSVWVHPKVAIHLAQWLSADFAVQVSEWVYDWVSGNGAPAKMPFHLERHMINIHKIPNGYFSVLQEMTTALVAPMESQGYRMPDHMMPDISHGRMLCKHLRDDRNINTDELPTYTHAFPDGREVEAKLYPVEYLGDFRRLLSDIWMKQKAADYFKARDPLALAALDKFLMIGTVAPKSLPTANKSKYKRRA
jgi:KilA-N domain